MYPGLHPDESAARSIVAAITIVILRPIFVFIPSNNLLAKNYSDLNYFSFPSSILIRGVQAMKVCLIVLRIAFFFTC